MIILCGPSATGKTEIAKILKQKYNLSKVITHTTREKRINEKDGVDYHFVTKEEFIKLKNDDEFVESAEYSGNYYGSSKKEISINKCLILVPNRVKSYNEINDPTICIFFLEASEETRIKRMQERKDEEKNIIQRINNDRKAFENKKELADFLIDTEGKSLDSLADQIYSLYLSKINWLINTKRRFRN